MSVSAERNIRRFDRRSIFIIIKNVNEANKNSVCTVMRSHETAIMLGLSLQKDTRLVSWGHFSLLSIQSSIKCGVSSQRNLCHFFGS